MYTKCTTVMDHAVETSDALLIGKVRVLLFDSQQKNELTIEQAVYEAQLVGLLLLTRVHNAQEFHQIFTDCLSSPHSIVLQWLLQKRPLIWKETDENFCNENVQCVFVRLFAQLWHRWLQLPGESSFISLIQSREGGASMIHYQMMQSIVQFSFATTISCSIVPPCWPLLQMEVLSCLRTYLQRWFGENIPAGGDSLELLIEPIWKSLLAVDTADSSLKSVVSLDAHNAAKVHPNDVMIETTHTLLQQTTFIDEDTLLVEDHLVPSLVSKSTLQFLLEYCIICINDMDPMSGEMFYSNFFPKCIPSLLEAWVHHRAESSISADMAHFLLAVLHLYLFRWRSNDASLNRPLHLWFKENGIAMSHVLQLLLACVVAVEPGPDQSGADLRTLAWSCVGCVLTGFGAASFMAADASSQWGTARPLCTILRLAVGEYKIQWSLRLDQEKDREDEDNQGASSKVANSVSKRHCIDITALALMPQFTILESCAEVILTVAQFLAPLADKTDDKVFVASTDCDDSGSMGSMEGLARIKFPPKAILHIQQSIQEAHLVNTQCLLHIGSSARDTDVPTNLHRNVVRIFAALFAELDVFLTSTSPVYMASSSLKALIPNEEQSAASAPQQLQAMHVALNYHILWDTYKDDVELFDLVVSCILKVLATAEGNGDLVTLLRTNHFLGESLVSFLERCFCCFMDTNHISSVIDLCEIMELSLRMEDNAAASSSRYQTIIIEFLKHHISRLNGSNSPSKSMTHALHALVSCYISLQDDTDIVVSHSSILQMALDLH